jgi:hypothetical protein
MNLNNIEFYMDEIISERGLDYYENNEREMRIIC